MFHLSISHLKQVVFQQVAFGILEQCKYDTFITRLSSSFLQKQLNIINTYRRVLISVPIFLDRIKLKKLSLKWPLILYLIHKEPCKQCYHLFQLITDLLNKYSLSHHGIRSFLVHHMDDEWIIVDGKQIVNPTERSINITEAKDTDFCDFDILNIWINVIWISWTQELRLHFFCMCKNGFGDCYKGYTKMIQRVTLTRKYFSSLNEIVKIINVSH